MNLNSALISIFKFLFGTEFVDIKISSGISLFRCANDSIYTPVSDLDKFFDKRRSPLNDSFVSLDKLEKFISYLNQNKLVVRLNHVGICYMVDSQKNEKQRLIQVIKNSGLNIYEEESNDLGLWLFVGDTKNWEDPLLELLPVEDTSDKWIDYWLPHIQIDLDTNLNADSIEKLSKEFFREEVKPFRVTVIDNIVYTVRLRLGTLQGVNIDLDLATNSRQVEYVRKEILKRVGY